MSSFRRLLANEVDLRVQSLAKDGSWVILIPYKDARVDMNILDETYGEMNWQRKQEVIKENLFCSVGIYDAEKGCWVWKQDVGTESFSDKEKGESSDAFKRACTNWGIGRELYTSPFIFINLDEDEVEKTGAPGKEKMRIKNSVKFHVEEIGYDDKGSIDKFIVSDNRKKRRFSYSNKFITTMDDVYREYNKCIRKLKVINVDVMSEDFIEYVKSTSKLPYIDPKDLSYQEGVRLVNVLQQIVENKTNEVSKK